jgi:hypothetical protein
LAGIRRRGCSGAAMISCLFESYMVCRCEQDMYLPAADDESPFQKNPRSDRRAREPAVSRNPGWLRPNLRGDDHAFGTLRGGALGELGLKPGDRVAAQVEKSVEALMLYLGAIRAGAIFLPLDTAYTSAELEYFLGDAEPKLLVCDPTRRDGLAPVAARAGVGAVATLGADGRGSSGKPSRRWSFRPRARGSTKNRCKMLSRRNSRNLNCRNA